MLADGEELALIDLREELIFSQSHLLFARSVPLSRLELKFARLVPRRGTRIVLCDDADGLVERAAEILRRAGYTNLFHLDGGVAAWAAAGFELFSGVNVPSKAFGEFVEHASATPSIAADELDRLIRDGTDMVVLDSRPFDEYQRVSIPTARQRAGRGAGAARPRPRALAGHPGRGQLRRPHPQHHRRAVADQRRRAEQGGGAAQRHHGLEPRRSHLRQRQDAARAGARRATASPGPNPPPSAVARRFGVERIDRATLERWRAERRAHALSLRRARSAGIRGRPCRRRRLRAGRTAGAGDRPICRHARRAHRAGRRRRGARGDDRVLAAPDGLEGRVRAGRSGHETGWPAAPILGPAPPPELRIDCAGLAELIARNEATVVDLSLSRDYRKAHIPGAWFAIRSRLAQALAKIPLRGTLVLTSEDGVLAGLAAPEARALVDRPVRYLDGGNAAWRAAGHPLTADDARMADEAVDIWLKPYERPNDTTKAMSEYLSWEVDLLARIERDGTTNFTPFRP